MSRYHQLKEQQHRMICEWMRTLDWKPSAARAHRDCAMVFFRKRHELVPRFVRTKSRKRQPQMVSRAELFRRDAIRHLAAAEIAENESLMQPTKRNVQHHEPQ